MGFFSHYVKKNKNINGKNITIFVQTKKYGLARHKELEVKIKYHRIQLKNNTVYPAKYLNQLLDKFSNEQVELRLINLVFETFFKVIQDNITLINFNSLYIYIQFSGDVTTGNASYNSEISRYNRAFFAIEYSFLLFSFFHQLCKYNRNLQIAISNYFDVLPESSLYSLLSHEFAHYLDAYRLKEVEIIRARIKNSLGESLYIEGSSFDVLSVIRGEGLGRFFQNKNEKKIKYEIDIIEEFRKLIKDYKGEALVSNRSLIFDYYSIGLYMYYFIGVAYLFNSNRNKFNGMRAYFSNKDFVFFTEGLDNILKKSPILLQNLPKNLIIGLFRLMLKWSHLTFIVEYGKACKTLNISERSRIFTLEMYKKMKKIDYDLWLSKVQKAGFSKPGLDLE